MLFGAVSEAITGFISAFTNQINIDAFADVMTALVPLMGALILFAFLLSRVRKTGKGASNGKFRI